MLKNASNKKWFVIGISVWILLGISQNLPGQTTQTVTISGQITDQDGEPIPGANILVEGTDRGAATGPNGRYRINDLPAGEHTLIASFIGYKDARITITIKPRETITQNIRLYQSAIQGDKLVVTGQRDILRTLATKRRTIAIIDVMDVETIQKLPLQDMSEALDRLPGVNIQGQSAGRGFKNAFVVIRGIQPNLNQVTVMGAPLASTSAERAVALDILPSNLASQLEVVKSPTADKDANTIGGTVNFVPFSAFDYLGPYFTGSVQGAIINEQGALEGEKLPLDVDLKGSARLNETLGLAVTLNYKQEQFSRTFAQPDDWETIPQPGFSDDLFVPEGTRLEQSRSYYQRLSGTLNLEWRPNPDSRLRLLGSHTESQNEEISTQTEFNYADGKTEIPFEMRSPTTIFSPTGENEKEMDIDDQTERLSFIIGQGEFRFNNWLWTSGASYSRAETNTNVNEWSFNSINFASTIDLSGKIPFAKPMDQQAFQNPSSYTFAEIDVEPEDKVSKVMQVTSDLKYNANFLGQDGFLKLGGLFRSKDILSDANETQYTFNENSGFSSVTLGGLGLNFDTPPLFGLPFSPGIDPFEGPKFINDNPDFLFLNQGVSAGEVGNDYKVEEDVVSGYLMGSSTIGNLKLTAGVRVEQTFTDIIVQTFDAPTQEIGEETFKNNYTNILPNIHLLYRFSDRFQVRGAATWTLARPGLQSLGSTRQIDFDNSDIVEGDDSNPTLVSDAEVQQGNPNLKPYESLNLDLVFEYYRHRGSFYSIGAFYKNIDNPIFTQTIERQNITLGDTEYIEVDFEQPLNSENGTLLGLEAQVQETFTFLPGALRNLGVTANIVYLHSQFEVPGREGEDLPFFRQPDIILAVTPYWGYRGFEARLAYQYTDEFVTGFGGSEIDDEYVDARATIDLQLSYGFAGRYTLSFGIENLTNEPFRQYQGSPERIISLESTGTQYWFGVRAKF